MVHACLLVASLHHLQLLKKISGRHTEGEEAVPARLAGKQLGDRIDQWCIAHRGGKDECGGFGAPRDEVVRILRLVRRHADGAGLWRLLF